MSPPHNFRRTTKVYLVQGGVQYKVDAEYDISFNQTFTEKTSSVKTIHDEFNFERSTIKKANPANFSFTINLIKEPDARPVFDRLIDTGTFDLYFQSDESTFKLQNAVLTNGTFQIERTELLKLAVEGQAEVLSRVGAGEGTYTVPGNAAAVSNTKTYPIPQITLTLDSANISTEVYSLSMELQNDVTWTKYETVQKALGVTNRTNAMFPSGFTVEKRILSGNIGRYVTDGTASTFMNFKESANLEIKVGTGAGTYYGFSDWFTEASSSLTGSPSEATATAHAQFVYGLYINNSAYIVNNGSTGNEDATRYGLYRKPTFAGLTYWVNQILGGDSFSTVVNNFFQSASGNTSIPYNQGTLTEAQRILTQNKSFAGGTGYGILGDRGTAGTFRGVQMGPATCSFTNRVALRETYTQSFDWRLTDNSALNNILQYITG